MHQKGQSFFFAQICFLFENCADFESDTCFQCVSGEVDCDSDICFEEGFL